MLQNNPVLDEIGVDRQLRQPAIDRRQARQKRPSKSPICDHVSIRNFAKKIKMCQKMVENVSKSGFKSESGLQKKGRYIFDQRIYKFI